MPRYLGALLEIGLIIFLLILFIPYVGPIAWLVAGRPVPWPSTTTAGFPEYERPVAPDDDAAFIARLAASGSSDRRLLAQWEADLHEREAKLRDSEQKPADGTGEPGQPATA